jgi:pyruvate/2-oxoglutarate dehydrogenase complex dihydrolipoamide dehydrogenase (E3) component
VSRVRQIYCDVLRNNGVELIEGRASMQDAHTVVVHAADGKLLRTLTAANIVLATGSKSLLSPQTRPCACLRHRSVLPLWVLAAWAQSLQASGQGRGPAST